MPGRLARWLLRHAGPLMAAPVVACFVVLPAAALGWMRPRPTTLIAVIVSSLAGG